MTQRLLVIATAGIIALLPLGCATKKHVRQEVERIDKEMQTIESSVEENQVRDKEQDSRLASLSQETQEALTRAQSAEKLAQGKLLYEVALTDDQVKFKTGRAELPDTGKEILDNLLEQLKTENKNVYIEIQGYTDSRGSDKYNMKLGEDRAESVRRYLAENGIPLHRINTISYGESRPLASNSSSDGRSKNRRVVVLVLQ
jgi:peptidoglycan-associated lipoprotein